MQKGGDFGKVAIYRRGSLKDDVRRTPIETRWGGLLIKGNQESVNVLSADWGKKQP